jgi:hypothetical protein
MTRHRIAGGAAMAFGLLTVVSGGTALMGAIDMGAVVPFVLWFNFLAGVAYLGGGLLLWQGRAMALPVALAILIATLAVFAAFGWRVASGAAYEMRTVGAMALRSGFWAVMSWVAWRARG